MKDRQRTCKGNFEARARKQCCCGKAVSIYYSECVPVALGIEHSMHMLRNVLSSGSSLALPYLLHIIA